MWKYIRSVIETARRLTASAAVGLWLAFMAPVSLPAQVAQPVNAPVVQAPEPSATPPAPNDFSDGEFAQADQPETGERRGGGTIDPEDVVFVVLVTLAVLLILVLIV